MLYMLQLRHLGCAAAHHHHRVDRKTMPKKKLVVSVIYNVPGALPVRSVASGWKKKDGTNRILL